ncbi:hypothetical protein J2739_000101 [Variovorax soli]|uniref:Uncharacterized protein n=1 Tax=Variovorax soli TaxID=376815 RepID=A0ABU1N8D9_9BURK|nr:hypothetical protein [Variovorax soli]
MSAGLLPLPCALGEGGAFVRLLWRCALFEAGAGASSRQPSHFLLLRQKKVTKEKATPLRVTLRFATGNLRCSLQAGSAQTRFAQTRAALDPPEAALLGTRRGEWTGPSLRSASNGLAARGLERMHVHVHVHGPTHTYAHGHGHGHGHGHTHTHTNTYEHGHVDVHGMCLRLRSVSQDLQRPSSRAPHKDAPWRVGVQLPSGRSRGAQLFADQGRACLSEASLRGPREKRAPQASRSEAQGRGQWGRLFFGYFLLAKQKKVTRPPGRHPGPGLKPTATPQQSPEPSPPLQNKRGTNP